MDVGAPCVLRVDGPGGLLSVANCTVRREAVARWLLAGGGVGRRRVGPARTSSLVRCIRYRSLHASSLYPYRYHPYKCCASDIYRIYV